MKVTVLGSDLLPALQTCSRFVTTRSQLPILSNLKLEAKGSKLVISATNLEMSITTHIGAKLEKEGVITIPSKTFTDLVSNIKSKHITLKVDGEKIIVSSDSSKTTLVGSNASDFPELTESIDTKAIILSSDKFAKALPQVAFCSSPDDTRPALSGVLFIFDTLITIVASDGYRLSKRHITKNESDLKGRFILPKNMISELLKIIKEDSEKIKLFYSEEDKQVVIQYLGYIITSRVVDGEYPNFEKIIPDSSRIEVSINKEDLLNSLKVISIIAREAANIAEFNFKDKSVTISAESNKSGEGSSELPANIEGASNLSIMFNYRFVIDFLNSIDGENVVMKLNDSASAGVFTDVSNSDYLHLIMPVKL